MKRYHFAENLNIMSECNNEGNLNRYVNLLHQLLHFGFGWINPFLCKEEEEEGRKRNRLSTVFKLQVKNKNSK